MPALRSATKSPAEPPKAAASKQIARKPPVPKAPTPQATRKPAVPKTPSPKKATATPKAATPKAAKAKAAAPATPKATAPATPKAATPKAATPTAPRKAPSPMAKAPRKPPVPKAPPRRPPANAAALRPPPPTVQPPTAAAPPARAALPTAATAAPTAVAQAAAGVPRGRRVSQATAEDVAPREAVGEGVGGRTALKKKYKVLLLRHLPPTFQEPQLRVFLSQLGSPVRRCFCVRSRKTGRSKGSAVVQFADRKSIALAIKECRGMMLGGRVIRASKGRMAVAMPPEKEVTRRRRLGEAYDAKGKKLTRFVTPQAKDVVAALVKHAEREREINKRLKEKGVKYQYWGFGEQLKQVKKELLKSTKKVKRLIATPVEEVKKVTAVRKGSTKKK